MHDIYNKYLRLNNIHDSYESEIIFINNSKPYIVHELFYVEFSDKLDKRAGYYKDNNNYLRNLHMSVLKDGGDRNLNFFKKSKDLIINLQFKKSYYTFIKVIKDKKNPQLEGQVMIFNFGRVIKYKIELEFENQEEEKFCRTFKIMIKNSSGFPNYDSSHFTNNELKITDETLDINSEISFKQINITAIERQEKLKNINLEIDFKQARYEEYLKLKEEFENEN